METIIIFILLIVLSRYIYLCYQLNKKIKHIQCSKILKHEVIDTVIKVVDEIEDIDEFNHSNSSVEDKMKAFTPISDCAKYYEKKFIQTISERKVYEKLLQIFENYHVNIFPQVPYSCIVKSRNKKYDIPNFLRISQKRVDFVITDKCGNTLFVIELDGDSHKGIIQKKKDADRDAFFNHEAISIPVWRIPLSEIMEDMSRNSGKIMRNKLENCLNQNHMINELLKSKKNLAVHYNKIYK